MSNWLLAVYRDWLSHVAGRLRQELLKQEYLHIDETHVQVLKEPGRKNTSDFYVWVYCSIRDCRQPHFQKTSMTRRLHTAFQYALNNRQEFINHLEDGNCSISNSLAENCIRPFVISRKFDGCCGKCRSGADDHCPFSIEGWWLFFYPLSYLTLTNERMQCSK